MKEGLFFQELKLLSSPADVRSTAPGDAQESSVRFISYGGCLETPPAALQGHSFAIAEAPQCCTFCPAKPAPARSLLYLSWSELLHTLQIGPTMKAAPQS